MRFELPELLFDTNAFEPIISKKTMELHHGIHNRVYYTVLNELVAGTNFENKSLETIIRIADGKIFNYAALAWNHTFYFETIAPIGVNAENNNFNDVICDSFGSLATFRLVFTKAATSLLGSGWVWLIRNQDGLLEIQTESNAGNPLRRGLVPLIACDMWEHAYYLDYNNKSQEYVERFLDLINWASVERRYNKGIQYPLAVN